MLLHRLQDHGSHRIWQEQRGTEYLQLCAVNSDLDFYLQFIDVVTKPSLNKLRAGSSLGSCTQKIQAVRLRNHEFYGSKLVLVDTPGFDDDRRSDMEILELIGDWLKKT